MCTQCVPGQYLTDTTCDSKCSPPLFQDNSTGTGTCNTCPYYCNACTQANNCQKCKPGFLAIIQDCAGENFLRVNSTQSVTVPVNSAIVPDNPSQVAFELWFKADNILTLTLDIIMGLSPYKLRKKAGTAQIQFNWGDLNYCDSTNLKSNQWYHFGLSMDEANGGSLYCYLDGNPLNIGSIPVTVITMQIVKFKEITFGSSIDIKTTENRFTGYIKEFRWWNNTRSQFQITNFKNIAITDFININPPNTLLAYWRLSEKKTDPYFSDSASGGTVIFDPTSVGKTLLNFVEMREIYLKMCPEGTFVYFNETLGFYNCTPCNSECKNCNGVTNRNCTQCNPPYKLLETSQQCIISVDCPKGYWIDINKNCWPCHSYCTDCYGSDQFQCTACKVGYFKAYKKAGCVSSCPMGLYGNYLTQSCSANPVVLSLYPQDGLIIPYGSFVDLEASYNVLNEEPRNTYSYGWIITKLNSDQDIAADACKTYANTDILKVHLDNNIIQPNNYYNITFYVKGDASVYNGMLGSLFNVIYIGIPPKGGACMTNPPQGIAVVTEFNFVTGNWIDPDGISEFRFFYSFDEGETFLPVKQDSYTTSSIKYTFAPIFKTTNVVLQCQVKSIKGFIASSNNTFLLIKKSNVNSKVELQKMSLDNVNSEQSSLQAAFQISSIATDLGSVNAPDQSLFNPKVEPDQCSDAICSFNGNCTYNSFKKKYVCQCYGLKAGTNCTFKNKTELQLLQNLTLENAKMFIDQSQGSYDTQFLAITSSMKDLMTDDLFDKMHDIIYDKVLHMGDTKSDLDTTSAQKSLQILSNMLEYLDYDAAVNNVTGSWNSTKNSTLYQEKVNRSVDNLNRTMNLIKMVQNLTLYKLSEVQPTVEFSSRMVSYKQVLTNKDQILTMPATSGLKRNEQAFVKISPANFINETNGLQQNFIAEAIEYAVNPYQIGNNNNLAGNVFEFNLYNQNKSVISNDINKVQIKNLPVPIEFSFPASNNHNLTLFFSQYNALSPNLYANRVRREQLLSKSGLKCVYWENNHQWSSTGCTLTSLDNTHAKCSCSHLSAFSITFQTPKLAADAPLLENTTIKADTQQQRTVTVSDIVRWPLSDYISNLGELWQHNAPSFIIFILKPGFAILLLFWSMYLSGVIYYSGRDTLKRDKMTKSQNRDDLAEMKDDDVQNLHQVIRDLIVRDFLAENAKFIEKQSRRMNNPNNKKKQLVPPQIKIYEQMTKKEQKQYKERARKKVFGVPGTLSERAKRFYKSVMKKVKQDPNAKQTFFNEQLKNNLWISLVAKTSKIAPRHVRLALMYFYASLYITILTVVFAFQLQEAISSNLIAQLLALSLLCHFSVQFIAIPVALIFRMPLSLRRMIAGVKTKKLNKAFTIVDSHMGWRYSIGYFFCLTMYFIMTVVVLVFNTFYPQDYVIGWAFNIILLYLLDMIVFTFGLAGLQLVNAIISEKVRCWYHVWASIEIYRYVKNLRG